MARYLNALIELLAGLIRLLVCTPMKRGPWIDPGQDMPRQQNVDGIVHTLGGHALQRACRYAAPVPIGSVAITTSGDLAALCGAKHVLHAVCPDGQSNGTIEAIYTSMIRLLLKMADTHGARSLAVPALGTGVKDWNPKLAAKLMLNEIARTTCSSASSLREVTVVLPDARAWEAYNSVGRAGWGEPKPLQKSMMTKVKAGSNKRIESVFWKKLSIV